MSSIPLACRRPPRGSRERWRYLAVMTTSDGIRTDAASVERLLELDLEALIEFAPDDPSDLASGYAVRCAMEAADSEVDGLRSTGPEATVAGFSTELRSVPDMEAVTAWLTAFARAVVAEGMTGAVHALPLVQLPQWLTRLREPRLTAFVAFDRPFADSIGSHHRDPRQDPEERAVMEWFDRAAAWVVGFSGDVYVGNGGRNQLAGGCDIAWYLYRALHHGFIADVNALASTGDRAASAGFSRDGQALFQRYASSTTLVAQADHLRDAILGDVGRTRLAFVAVTSQGAYGGWESRADVLPALPTIEPKHLRVNAPLWASFVPDVHGMQLLTQEHLDKAADLSAWTVTPAGPGRYLVEAPHLAEWFKADGPAEATLAQARADFGQMIVPSEAFA